MPMLNMFDVRKRRNNAIRDIIRDAESRYSDTNDPIQQYAKRLLHIIVLTAYTCGYDCGLDVRPMFSWKQEDDMVGYSFRITDCIGITNTFECTIYSDLLSVCEGIYDYLHKHIGLRVDRF